MAIREDETAQRWVVCAGARREVQVVTKTPEVTNGSFETFFNEHFFELVFGWQKTTHIYICLLTCLRSTYHVAPNQDCGNIHMKTGSFVFAMIKNCSQPFQPA